MWWSPSSFFSGVSVLSGLLAGSFLNVLIYRLPRKQDWIRGRSACPHCQHALGGIDLLPLLGYFIRRGRCVFCQQAIAWRYPLVEALTALLFYASYQRQGFSWLLIACDWPWLMILLAVTFIDLDFRLIPNVLSLSGLLIGVSTAAFHPGLRWPEINLFSSLGGAFLGFFLFFLLSELYYRWTGREGLGGGDVKLLAMIGSFLGPQGVLTTLLLSSLTGSLAGLGLAAFHREKSNWLQFSIPYGPFLVLGALVHYFLGPLPWLFPL